MGFVLLVPLVLALLFFGGGYVKSSVVPRLEAKKERRELETSKAQEKSARESVLNRAAEKLARVDVAVAQGKTLDERTIFDYLPPGYDQDSLTSEDMKYIREQYSVHVEEETNKHLGKRLIENELDQFGELRERHKRNVQHLESARETVRIGMNKDEHAEAFAQLETTTTEEGR